MIWSAVALFVLTPLAQSPSAKPKCEADVFVLQDLEKQPRIPSPDGRYEIVPSVASQDDDHGEIRFYEHSKLLAKYAWTDLSTGVFVKWAEDSRGVYVMWSNGGITGGYDVRVFRMENSAVRELPVSKADTEFERKFPCRTGGANILPITWLNGSAEMLLEMQVYSTSDCGKHMGLIRGYRVRVEDGTILERYSEKQIRALSPPTCPAPLYPTAFWTSDDLAKAKAALRKKRGG